MNRAEVQRNLRAALIADCERRARCDWHTVRFITPRHDVGLTLAGIVVGASLALALLSLVVR